MSVSLTSMTGISSVSWYVKGRPEGSVAGGAGPEPVFMATAPTAAFTVDTDAGAVRVDGTYTIEAVINPGAPSETRKTAILCRLSGLTIPGTIVPRQLRKLGGFESLEDTSVAGVFLGWATMLNRWLEAVRLGISGGGGGTETLAAAYLIGTVAADQTLPLTDAKGGGLIVDGSGGGFTGASSLRVNTAAGSPVVIARATGRLGLGTAAPATQIHALSAAPTLRLERSGGAALDVANVADNLDLNNGATLLGRFMSTGGLRADLGVGIGSAPSTSSTLSLGAGDTATVSSANTTRFRYNVALQRAELSENGGPYRPFGAGNAIPRVANIAAMVALPTAAFSASEAHLCEVITVGDLWRFDPTVVIAAWSGATTYDLNALVVDGGVTFISIQAANLNHLTTDRAWWFPSMERAASGDGLGSWVRMLVPNQTWRSRFGPLLANHWAIDPAGTFSTPGNDEALGTLAAPLRSVAEWRRRMGNAVLPDTCYIKALSSSTRDDDGVFTGPTGLTLAIYTPCLYADPIVVFSGTLTNAIGMSGPTRGQVTDAGALGGFASWTLADGITTSAASRWIRNTAKTKHAPLLVDLGAKTAQIGNTTSTSEDPTVAPTSNLVAFTTTETYDVIKYLKWPPMRQGSLAATQLRCLDTGIISTATGQTGEFFIGAICGFVGSIASINTLLCSMLNCVFPTLIVSGNVIPLMSNCSFLQTTVQFGGGTRPGNWNGSVNIFINSTLRFWHGGALVEGGVCYTFDNTIVTDGFLSVRHGSTVERIGIQGSGNTQSLIVCELGSNVYVGGPFDGGIVATTSLALPIVLAGVAYSLNRLAAGSIIDSDSGCGIYRN